MRDLDYETDLLARLDWRGFDPALIAARIPDNAHEVVAQMQRIELSDDGTRIVTGKAASPVAEAVRFDPSHAVRIISDIVLNPFVARDIVGGIVQSLRQRGFDDARIGRRSGLIIDTLRKELDAERSRRAEALFRLDVKGGRIQFRLRLDGRDWKMPRHAITMEPVGARVLAGKDGNPVKASLFSPFHEADLNAEERGVAVMLDEAESIRWWHRNVAKSEYGLQGWKRGRIYPDFIFAVSRMPRIDASLRLRRKAITLRTWTPATSVMCCNCFPIISNGRQHIPAGQLQLEHTGDVMECALILMSDIPTELPRHL